MIEREEEVWYINIIHTTFPTAFPGGRDKKKRRTAIALATIPMAIGGAARIMK